MKKALKIIHISFLTIGYAFFAFLFYGLISAFVFGYDQYEWGDAVDLGNGYTYFVDNRYHSIDSKDLQLDGIILNYNFDERHIILKQNLFGRYTDCTKKYNYPSIYGNYYWIIDKESDSCYGPMRLGKFKNMCDSLNVNLKFVPENNLRPDRLDIGQEFVVK